MARRPSACCSIFTPGSRSCQRRRTGRAARSWPAVAFEVRLTEFSPDNMPFLPLWVELFRESGRELVEGCGFSEIEDAVEAVRELVEEARRLHDGS